MSAAMPSSPSRADVLIIGGGLVGISLGIALARHGVRVVAVDSAVIEATLAPSFDGRASAIASASARMLQAIGVWPGLEAVAQPIWEIRVTDGDSPLFLHFDGSSNPDEPLGYMFENRRLRFALYDTAATLDGLTLLSPDQVRSVETDSAGATVTLASGAIWRVPLVVAADGRRSQWREKAGIPIAHWSYEQAAVITTVQHAEPHGDIAHERFLPAGPFAILPLSDDEQGRHRSSIVWTVAQDDGPAIMKLSDAAFRSEIADRFGDFMGDISLIAPRWSYPLTFHHADRYVVDRFALIGDSAHGIHPIAGQGLNMGLRDVAAMAEVLVEASRLGLDLGSPVVLERYQRWRRTDNMVIAAVTDGLNRLFSNRLPGLPFARRLGLAAVHRLPPLKSFFMNHARGTVGQLPRLLRGATL
jgi:2-octaprenyl-6-methoxyphenol hydroxylase